MIWPRTVVPQKSFQHDGFFSQKTGKKKNKLDIPYMADFSIQKIVYP